MGLVSQVSFSAYPNNVTRAMAAAVVIGKVAGETDIPAVAGERINVDAEAMAAANRATAGEALYRKARA